MLPVNTIFGDLEIIEVYEYLDGPRLFAARDTIGTTYLVYWVDETENATVWLYLPISEAKLKKLRRKNITLNTAYKKPETHYYLVYTGIQPKDDTVQMVTSVNDLPVDFFPPEGYYIEYVNVINKKTEEWSFETILTGAIASADAVSQFIGRFCELIGEMINGKIYPQSAAVGSLKIKFTTDNSNKAIESLKLIAQLIQCSAGELQQQLSQHKINPSQLKDFLSAIKRNRLNVKLVPKLAADGEPIELEMEDIDQCLKRLNDIKYITIDSIKVPQADDIDKVLKVVKLLNDDIPLLPENIDGLTTSRQVKYYTDAAWAYGLITKDKQLTTAGYFVDSRTTQEDKYAFLADRFESTDFGWAWITWAEVQNMTELDPDNAVDFLLESAPKLSEATAKRRSRTLRTWLITLRPHHRKYQPE